MLLKSQTFIYDGAKLIGEYNSDGTPKNEYIYLDNIPVAVIPRGYPQDGVKYIHTDHLGTPRRLADENGNIVWSWESEPFGESKAIGSVEFNLRFAGQYFDNETSTHYNINRDYDPKTGRYIESDPIGFDGGVNSYGYVGGNPLGAVDEMGLRIQIKYGMDNDANLIIKSAFNKLNTTKTGAKLISILNKNPNTYTIAIQNSILGNYNTYGSEYRFENRTVYIDPYRSGKINTEKGMQITTKTVTLAHELGHATGMHDDGKDQMNNVRKWENPVRKELKLPLRVTYGNALDYYGKPLWDSTAI